MAWEPDDHVTISWWFPILPSCKKGTGWHESLFLIIFLVGFSSRLIPVTVDTCDTPKTDESANIDDNYEDGDRPPDPCDC